MPWTRDGDYVSDDVVSYSTLANFSGPLETHIEPMATFASGAKSTEVKPRYDLIPAEAAKREAIRWAEGVDSHGERNWQKGVADAQFILDRTNHLVEHALLYANGDRSTDHLGAIRCNAGMLAWFEAHPK